MRNTIKIGENLVGEGYPTYIIAELSANHGHDIEQAFKSIQVAAECGVDAVKIQTYRADTITIDSRAENFVKKDGLWKGKSLYELYSEGSMPWEWQPKLKEFAESLHIDLFSSPFDVTSVDFLETMNVPAYKIASFEITDIPLIEYVAKKNKPVIISTGIATFDEISDAVNACKKVGNSDIILLKCTSQYPAPIEDANLVMIKDLAEKFNVIAGFSDHTLGITAPILSVALGAKVIEKHFILDKTMHSVDAAFSLDRNEFKSLVKGVREAEKMIGKIDYSINEAKEKSRQSRRSLFVVKDIKKGERFSEDNVKSIRPGQGLEPKYLSKILGKTAAKNIGFATPFTWDFIEE